MLEYRSAPLKLNVSNREVAGYAARFNIESHDLGGFVEMIRSGAFGDALTGGDTIATVEHDCGRLLGRRSAGTLTLGQDNFGLWFRVLLPDTSLGRDTLELVRRGDLNGCSFAMSGIRDSWKRIDGRMIRSIESIKELGDVSLVSRPAYPQTSISVGSTPVARAADLTSERLAILRIKP